MQPGFQVVILPASARLCVRRVIQRMLQARGRWMDSGDDTDIRRYPIFIAI
jgi:hypothetical protein